MPDINKLYEKAEKYVQRQKYEAARDTYQEILRFEPDDEEALVNLGELSLKLNRTADALRYLLQLTEHHSRRHDLNKAIATCRKVLKLSPQDVATLAKLAALLERSKKNVEALEAYREALRLHRKLGADAPSLECLTHIVKLDPNSLEEHEELGDLALQLRQAQTASTAFMRAAQLARAVHDESRWEKLVEKAHEADPSDEQASIAATELYVKRGLAPQAVALIAPVQARRPDDLEVLELASRAFLGVEDYSNAGPVCLRLYQAKPERVDLLLQFLEGMLRKGAAQQVLEMVNELKDRLIQQGRRSEFLRIVEKVYECDESNLELLELLTSLYNDLNQEDGLRRSLSRLFGLYLASEQYTKAADTLDRILDVDPYGEGHNDRLLNLEGHIDRIWYKNIQERLQPPSASRTASAQRPPGGATAAESEESLEDLVVEAEMYYQYQLSAKLRETLEKIDRVYPGAEEKHQGLRELYLAARYTPHFKAPARAPTFAPVPPAESSPPSAASFQSLDDLRKVSEITAQIFRESTPQGVMRSAVHEIGRAFKVSRCWGAMGTADLPPVLMAEYCSPLATPSEEAVTQTVFSTLMATAVNSPDGWSFDNPEQASLLPRLEHEFQKLGIHSLLALPLMEKDASAGLLLLEQCEAPRVWSQAERLLLKAIATQVVMAVNNTKLRRLVHSLAGADPETGLLPRSSYLDCLLAEAERSREAGQPLSVCILEPENPRALMKMWDDAGMQRFVHQVTKFMIPALRHNDISIRYSPLSIVVVFPDTALPQAGLAVEKVRRALAQIRVNGAEAPGFCAAVCDVPLGPTFQAVDGVTEVINRLEASLDRARKEGPKRVLISKFTG